MKGDIVLVPFPNSDLTPGKLRPALVLYEDEIEKETTIAYISSRTLYPVFHPMSPDTIYCSDTNLHFCCDDSEANVIGFCSDNIFDLGRSQL